MKKYDDWSEKKKTLNNRSYIPPEVKIGDVYWFSFGLNIGKEIDGKSNNYTRPAVIYKIITRTSFLVIPLTTSEYFYDSWHMEIINHKQEKTLLCFNNIRVMDFRRMKNFLFSLKENDLSKAIDHFNKLFCSSSATNVAGDRGLRPDASAVAPNTIITNVDILSN